MHEICSVVYYVVNEGFGNNDNSDDTVKIVNDHVVASMVFSLFSKIMIQLIVFYDVAGEGRRYVNAKLSSDTETDGDMMERIYDDKKR